MNKKIGELDKVVGLIDGTVIGIDRPDGDQILQRVEYKGHKRNYVLMF